MTFEHEDKLVDFPLRVFTNTKRHSRASSVYNAMDQKCFFSLARDYVSARG